MSEIAVIVPVYKAEKYLSRCVDSILSQSYPDLRLILVDDGSPDTCPQICDAYAHRDPRVHVIHQSNSGPSAARNRGIEWALENTDCAYLSFIDSDDCVHLSYFQRLYEASCIPGAGAAMCMHRYINQNETLEPESQNSAVPVQLMSAEDLLIARSDSFNYPWGKLFFRKCFENLRYPEDVSFGEDNLVIYKALFGCENVAFVEEKLYYYFYNAEGITKSPWSERSLQVFLGIEAQMDYYKSNGYDRAYRKETEMYIQQCAYQIHRIREDTAMLKQNHHHLIALQTRMRRMLRESEEIHLRDSFYWYEALHPQAAKVQSVMMRIRRNLKENGFAGTLRKLTNRARKEG